jgi:hypothetical protein
MRHCGGDARHFLHGPEQSVLGRDLPNPACVDVRRWAAASIGRRLLLLAFLSLPLTAFEARAAGPRAVPEFCVEMPDLGLDPRDEKIRSEDVAGTNSSGRQRYDDPRARKYAAYVDYFSAINAGGPAVPEMTPAEKALLGDVINFVLFRYPFEASEDFRRLASRYLSLGYFDCIASAENPAVNALALRLEPDPGDRNPLAATRDLTRLRYAARMLPRLLDRYVQRLQRIPDDQYEVERDYWRGAAKICLADVSKDRCAEQVRSQIVATREEWNRKVYDEVICTVGIVQGGKVYVKRAC